MPQDSPVTNKDLSIEVGIINSQLNGLISSLDSFTKSVWKQFENTELRHAALENKVNERSQFRWPIAIGMILAIFALVAYNDKQTNLVISNATAPLITQNQVSTTDRAEIRSTISRNGDRISDLESSQVRQTERATEVETQIHDLHTIGNLDRSYQMAFISALWQKTFYQDLSYRSTETQPRILVH